MPETMQLNVGMSLLLIHKAITRGMDVAVERSGLFARVGSLDAAAREGFRTYARTLVTVLHTHHSLEDEIVFPYFRDKVPDAPYDELSSDHLTMGSILREI